MSVRTLQRRLLALTASLVTGFMATSAVAQPADPMAPASDPRSAIVSPLAAVTIATGDMATTRRFYEGALGMTAQPVRITGAHAQALIRHWGLAPGTALDVVTFSRPAIPEAIIVRAISVSTSAPSVRPEYDAEIPGVLGMGVPVADLKRRDGRVTGAGFQSVVGVTYMDFPRADKTTYTVGEVHYRAPDDVLVLGVDRDQMRPVGPIDPEIGIGGPSYSSAIVADADRSARFLKDVLGLEMRREFTFQSGGDKGGMGLPKGADVRFQQWFTPGSATGYLVIMHLPGLGKPNPTPLGLRARGVGMWSFETNTLPAVLARARRANTPVLHGPTLIDAPGVGRVRSVVLASPDGLPVEVYARVTKPRP